MVFKETSALTALNRAIGEFSEGPDAKIRLIKGAPLWIASRIF